MHAKKSCETEWSSRFLHYSSNVINNNDAKIVNQKLVM